METVSAQGNFKAALLMSQPQKGVCVVYCSMYGVAEHFVWCLTGSIAGAGRFCSGHPSPLLFPLGACSTRWTQWHGTSSP